MKKIKREDRILEALNFSGKTSLQNLSVGERAKIWDRLKKRLFWDDPGIILGGLKNLEKIQGELDFLIGAYFIPIQDPDDPRAKIPKVLPEIEIRRVLDSSNGVFRYIELFESIQEHAIYQIVKLISMPPALPLNSFYQCKICRSWTYKKSKFNTCSKKCYDLAYRRSERSTQEGKKKNRERSKQAYRKKILGQ